ncbi:MAG TPA: class II aldolase/adducin family protein, partial [Thermoanaerobaculia bacterium]
MINRWSDVRPLSPVDDLVHQSRLVGAEESLVLWGGGNNSIKTTAEDLLGNTIEVMLIKSSGSDMKSIAAKQFPAVRLDYIRPLRHRAEMSDEEMADYLTRCLTDPSGPRPSIETLLHAFLPAVAVLHTHADAILALTNTKGGQATVRRCFGDSVIRIPYRRPGFLLSREVAEGLERAPDSAGLILMNHGLITWGASAREAYERHIDLVSRAEEFAARGESVSSAKTAKRSDADRVGPVLRGALSDRRSLVLELDDSEAVMQFVSRPDLDRVSQHGAATPDHLLHTKRFPVIVKDVDAVRAAVDAYIEKYAAIYATRKSAFPMLDPTPRVILVPGIGMFTAGKDARAARIVRDIYRHTIEIITTAERLGG